MTSFQWDTYFETEIPEVDEQHFQLITLLNQFGQLVTSDRLNAGDLQRVYDELVDYARYHFEEEELLMAAKGVATRHLNSHLKAHKTFIKQLHELFQPCSNANERQKSAKRLLDFLVHWLAYHILGTDQNMARQLKAIEQGIDAEEAFERQERKSDRATEPLLEALSGLFEQVTEQNQELMRLNQSLERKVEERTQELKALNAHLRELSLTDALTDLPNRRHAMRQLGDLWHESKELVCLMVDADYFKQVNDLHGHDAGDKVLIQLANCLKGAVRSDDLVCRLGGDEFLILCPETNLQGGWQLAQKIHQEVNRLLVSVGSGLWQGSISIGLAARTDEMDEHEALIKAADEQVYAAKRAGKNCVRAALPEKMIEEGEVKS